LIGALRPANIQTVEASAKTVAPPAPQRGSPAPTLGSRLASALDRRRAASLLRERRIFEPIDAVRVRHAGRVLVNFASNDYLGLTHHPRILAAMRDAAGPETGSAGSGAAGLISGYTPAHLAAELAIRTWKLAEAAVLLPSGYQANLAAVQTLAAVARDGGGAGARFLIDKLAHASLLDAVQQTVDPMRIFPHNGMAKLRRLLESADPAVMQIVVTESIFSMDGDAADLPALAQLKEQFGFVLLLDEAHASGIYGPGGAGYAAEMGLIRVPDITVCTLSKAAGVGGGAIVGSSALCDAVINFGRAYIYSTSVPPALGAAAAEAIHVSQEEPWRRERVRALALHVRKRLKERGWKLPTGDSPIIPIIMGDEESVLGAAARLENQGILCVALRPPTVPRGTSRLRITLSCEHTDEQIARLIAAIGSPPPASDVTN
jgi:8-amino-7-oxononanoate synthase